MRRPSFLSLFFIGLSAAFLIVLAIRIRRDAREPVAQSIPAVSRESVRLKPVLHSEAAKEGTKPVAQPATKPLPHRAERSIETQPVRPAPKKPSVIARVLAPLVKALTPVSKQAPPAAVAAAVRDLPRLSTPPQDQKQQSKDPNSDSTPPQLLSIQFSPPQIHDGEQSTVIVTATDDLSGIRGISGTLASPTGKAMMGFAAQHEADSDRWVAPIAMPKSAEQGTWRVRFLNLADNASNSTMLSDAQGTIPPTAVLRVVSAESDSTPPVLKNIWVDRRSMHGGEKNIVYVEATDDNSGVNLVSLVFQSPAKTARIGAGCQQGDSDVWRCEMTAPQGCLDCGDWQLEQVTLQDKANNIVTYRQDNPIVHEVRVNIQADSCNNTPPTLQSVSLDTNDVAVSPRGAFVTVTVVPGSDFCSVSSISGQYVGPGPGSGGVFPFVRSGADGPWIGRIQLDPHAAHGVWRISSIQLIDQGYNLRVYYSGDLLQNAFFRVH